MDSKYPGAKFSSNILSRIFDDNRSVGSGKSRHPLLVRLSSRMPQPRSRHPSEKPHSPATIHCVTNPGVSGSQIRIPTPTSCRNMRSVTSKPSTRPSVTKMLKLRNLNNCSNFTKVSTQMSPLKRSCQPFSELCSASTLPRINPRVCSTIVDKCGSTPRRNLSLDDIFRRAQTTTILS